MFRGGHRGGRGIHHGGRGYAIIITLPEFPNLIFTVLLVVEGVLPVVVNMMVVMSRSKLPIDLHVGSVILTLEVESLLCQSRGIA